MVKIITATKSGPIPTFKYLNDIVAILGSTKAFLWPFLESNGLLIQSYDNEDESLVPGNAGTPKSLDDAAAGFHPFKHVGGVHSYHFEAGNDQHLAELRRDDRCGVQRGMLVLHRLRHGHAHGQVRRGWHRPRVETRPCRWSRPAIYRVR